MTENAASEESRIVATYTTRRDAEMAQDRLQEDGIQAIITADDAGGMHPQLQLPHGVKLVALGREAERAHSILQDAGLLPPETAESSPSDGPDDRAEQSTEASESLTFSMEQPLFSATGIAYLVAFGLLFFGLLIAVLL